MELLGQEGVDRQHRPDVAPGEHVQRLVDRRRVPQRLSSLRLEHPGQELGQLGRANGSPEATRSAACSWASPLTPSSTT
jgi:hypothetical protein